MSAKERKPLVPSNIFDSVDLAFIRDTSEADQEPARPKIGSFRSAKDKADNAPVTTQPEPEEKKAESAPVPTPSVAPVSLPPNTPQAVEMLLYEDAKLRRKPGRKKIKVIATEKLTVNIDKNIFENLKDLSYDSRETIVAIVERLLKTHLSKQVFTPRPESQSQLYLGKKG